MGYLQGDKPITITNLLAMHTEREKITMLTAYDSTMSALLNRCGIEVILIGDSLGNVIQGHSSTTPVTVEQMVYHTECVARPNTHAFLIADLPFASYGDPVQALDSAAELMRAGADMVKLEGGDSISGRTQRSCLRTPWLTSTISSSFRWLQGTRQI